jgi:hypothetical protein
MRYCYGIVSLIALLFVPLASQAQSQATISYSPTEAIIPNPERGLQKYSITSNTYYTASNFSNVSEATLAGWRTGYEKVTVIYRYFLLGAYLQEDIAENYLENIQIDFDRIRNAGLKCLVRFSYTNRQSSEPQQPNKAQILRHLDQLAPILERNRDVIVAHQAGFIGTWGEWYYTNSIEFGTDGNINSIQWQNRKEVVDAMLAATPPEIPVQVRYPQAKIAMYGPTQLSEETAFQNTPPARIGFYNDAFLNIWGDMGTYRGTGQHGDPVRSTDFIYLANETQFTPMTGETNGLNPPRTSGENALREMDLANWSIINRDYHASVINGWIASGHFDEMLRRLGYRFTLRNSTFRIAGGELIVDVSLTNDGFARPFRHRDVILMLRSATGEFEYRAPVATDIRLWEGDIEINKQIERSELPDGAYDVFISIPDALLPERAEYAIQFANEDVWSPESGLNFLGRINLHDDTVVSTVNEAPSELKGSRLRQNYPNPFRDETVISYHLNQGADVRVAVYDLSGRLVAELERGSRSPGKHKVVWDGSRLGSGVYLVRLELPDATESILASLVRL